MKRKLLLILLCFGLFSCGHKSEIKSIDYITDLKDDHLVKIADKNFELGHYKKSQKLYAQILVNYPYSKFASKAQYMEALSYYKDKNYTQTIAVLNEYFKFYPVGEYIEDAEYLRAVSYYDQIININLDQTPTEKAKELFEQFKQKNSKSKYIQDVLFKLDLVNDQLAGKEMLIGRYYINSMNYNAAINRFLNVVKNYQTTNYITESLFRLVEAYIGIGDISEARKYASILGHNYPENIWYHKAYKLIQKGDRKSVV